MKILLKTKEELLKEGWSEDGNGSLVNTDFDQDVGYFSFCFRDVLGKELKVIDYLRDFYIAEPTTFLSGMYIPKSIVKEVL